MGLEAIGTTPILRERPFLILEAGVNHEGSLETAFEMVDEAAAAGAQAIKFQSYKAETLASRNSPAYWDRTKEPADSQFALFKRHDSFGEAEYRALADRCRERGIHFMSTPFDAAFVDLLDPLMPAYKVASADITNVPLLEHIASKAKPVLLSTGAAHLHEIAEAVQLLRDRGVPGIALLHCVLQYPTAPENAHLRAIEHLVEAFPGLTIGWSDHVPPLHGPQTMLAAWMLGADVIEKHFTLDKSLQGNDHYHAVDPADVAEFVRAQRHLQLTLGDRVKRVLECEAPARRFARRSLVATRAIKRGETIDAGDFIPKRPGTGIAPRFAEQVAGRRAAQDIEADTLLDWKMFD